MESFNMFKNLYLTEDGHTSILMRLLNPRGTHGMNNSFLKLFLDMLEVEYQPEDPAKWHIVVGEKSGERGFIDLIIRNSDNSVVIVIENKIRGAKNQPSQLYRYWRNHIYELLEPADKNNPIEYSERARSRYLLCYLTLNKMSEKSHQELKMSLTKPDANNGKYDNLPNELSYPVSYLTYKDSDKSIVRWLKSCVPLLDEKKDNVL